VAPYLPFADKAALLAAVANKGFELLHGALAMADDVSDAHEALVARGMAFVDFARAHPALFCLMYSDRYRRAVTDAVQSTYEVLAGRGAKMRPDQVAAATLASRALAQGSAAIELDGRLAPAEAGDIASAVRLLVKGIAACAA
jgi:hypothetical protein